LRVMQSFMAFLLKETQKTLKRRQDDFDASHNDRLYPMCPLSLLGSVAERSPLVRLHFVARPGTFVPLVGHS
jgi:hypothetical protein